MEYCSDASNIDSYYYLDTPFGGAWFAESADSASAENADSKIIKACSALKIRKTAQGGAYVKRIKIYPDYLKN